MSTCIRIVLPAFFLLHVLVLFAFLSINVIADHHSNGRGCMDKEREALLKFKNGVVDPYHTLSSWMGDECCRWFGVVCHNVTGHVIELKLSNTGFVGDVPPHIGNLSNLRILDLSFNRDMTIGNIGWLSHLSSLQYMDLSLVNISEKAPWFEAVNKLSSLSELRLRGCNLENVYAPHPQVNFTDLKVLDLSENNFHCAALPNWLSHLTNLEQLVVSRSNFTGPIPSYLGRMSTLQRLQLASNKFVGSLPNNWEQDSRLSILDLSYNGFSGAIPSSFDNLTELEYLNLANNDLSGQLRLLPMKTVMILHLQSNRFSGKIPQWIGENVSNKESLLLLMDLSNNELSGTIPSSFGNLTNLVSLYLGNNNLSGQLPLSMKNMKNLLLIDLHNNRLSGKIPSWMGENLSNLRFLNLRSNLFHGEVPRQLSRLASLQILDVANNTLSGSIPKSFRNFKAMTNTDNPLPSYKFGKSMWIVTKGRELFYEDLWENNRKDLDLSMNKFSGNIPKELTELKELESLNLSGNCLEGLIPYQIGELGKLRSLDLSRNRLSGVIPPNLSDLSFLGRFNVSNNNLSGKIPFTGQLTTFDNSSYIGNKKLCGPPLSKNCPGDQEEDEIEPWTLYIVTGSGLIGGICSVFGVLIANKSWRDMFYRFSDRHV